MSDISELWPYQAGSVVNDVLLGLDGYLFLYQGGHRQFDNLLGKIKPSSNSVMNFAENISKRGQYCTALGIKYRHVVFPSKPLVKTHFLPESYSLVDSLFEKNYLDSLTPDFVDTVLYPLDFLRQLESTQFSTFKKYDTHMTDFANLELAKLLSKESSGSIEAQWNVSALDLGGDLVKMLKQDLKISENVFSPANFKVQHFGNRKYLPSNGNEICIAKRQDNTELPRLLIFGDSFFKDMIPFLSGFYSTVVYFRSQFFHKDIVESIRPDVVFTGNAERYLHSVESDRAAGNILFELYGKVGYMPDIGFLNALMAELSFFYYPEKYKKISSLDNALLYDGRIESFNGESIVGWCIDSSVNVPAIDVVKNGVLVKRIKCTKERKDVIRKFGVINALNGFSFEVNGISPNEFEFYVSGKNVRLIQLASYKI